MACCGCQEGFTIRRGDDSDAMGGFIVFNIETEIEDLTGYTATFQVEDFRYTWDDITSKELELVITREESLQFTPGKHMGGFKVYDADGLAQTEVDNIPVYVKDMVVENPAVGE